MNLLIQNGRIIDPSQGMDCIGDLLVADGRIAQIGGQTSRPPLYNGATVGSPGGAGYCRLSVLQAQGMIVCPGFIDLHCHLRQPGFEEKETIASGTMAAARGGFTTVCCMPNTNPPIDTEAVVAQVQKIATTQAVVRVLPIGCITEGRSGKKLVGMSQLNKAGVVAFSDDGNPVWDCEIMRQALEQSKILDVPIIDHCEDLTLSRIGSRQSAVGSPGEGWGTIDYRLSTIDFPAAAEEHMIARDIELARLTGGRLHIAHVSTAGAVELIRKAKIQGINLTAEVTPHHLTLTEQMVITRGTNAKVSPPLRTEKDRNALVDGLREGVIDVIATDHAPHTEADKARSFNQAPFGISGLETALGSLMSLVHQGEIDLGTLVSRLTYQPAQIIRGSGLTGSLKIGSAADITIFDPDARWTVGPDRFASRGKNTPLAGMTLRGKVMVTIVAGVIAAV
ncbi:MAG: Dihydroorotase [Chloroflexi bacterium]|nr:Dihydroorotase [Chloroflexota bacterium]